MRILARDRLTCCFYSEKVSNKVRRRMRGNRSQECDGSLPTSATVKIRVERPPGRNERRPAA